MANESKTSASDAKTGSLADKLKAHEALVRSADPPTRTPQSAQEINKASEQRAGKKRRDARRQPIAANSIDADGPIDKDRIRALDQDVQEKFIADKKGKYYWKENPEVEAFRARAKKLIARSKSDFVARSMVSVADARGWQAVKVSGTQVFRREVWREAALRGMEVKGYTPTAHDLTGVNPKVNAIELAKTTGKAAALKAALTSQPRQDAVKSHPELKAVYRVKDMIESFAAKKITHPDNRERFVDKALAQAVDRVAEGKPLPAAEPQRDLFNAENETALER